jgi:hypothetical protein
MQEYNTQFPPSIPPPEQVSSKNKWLILIIVILALIIIGCGAYYFLFSNKQKTDQTNQTGQTTNQQTEIKNEIKSIIDPGVNWLTKPEKLGNLDLFNKENYPVQYYKIADLPNGEQIIFAAVESMGFPTYRFKKDKNGKYFLLKNNSDDMGDINQLLKLLNKEKHQNGLVQVDWHTTYNSLVPPHVLTFNKTEFVKNLKTKSGWLQDGQSDIASQPAFTKIGTTQYGDLFSSKDALSEKWPKIKSVEYRLKLLDTSLIYYTIRKDFLADDGTLIATFDSNYKSFASKKFQRGLMAWGCGMAEEGHIYDDSTLNNRLIIIGTTQSGDKLYIPKNNNDELLFAAYESYKVGRDQDKNLISFESFTSKNPVLIWQDSMGNYNTFADMDYQAMAECGKPVIYLYPEKTTSVSVIVGANIRISEPAYNDGWKVTADPDGALINNDGKIYSSLYWEGKGTGAYPTITNGRIVKRENIEKELRHDLTAQGLNQKESDDFISFWLAKMPATPYIRLSWLGTEEMNQLAPLHIFPKPNTLIRIFLDFAGQNTPEANIKPQNLSGISREGFTVVEWGGLLIEKQ